jgi:hypothetical protein
VTEDLHTPTTKEVVIVALLFVGLFVIAVAALVLMHGGAR